MTRERLHFAMPRPVPPGLWRRVPPAVFPPILGALGLALAWRGGVAAFALPPAVADLLAGMAVAIFAFAALAYGVKLARRPTVLTEDLAILPGRAGLGAAVLSVHVTAAVLGGFAPGAGRVLLVAGMALHLVLWAVLLSVLRRGPAEQRRVTPAWHLHFTGIVVAGLAAALLGWPGLAAVLFWPALAVALAIYAASLRQLRAARVPAPLRPMLAIHLAPLALFGSLALALGWIGAGQVFAWLALAGLAMLVLRARWLLQDGFSPLWGALTFPVAATAGVWVALWRTVPSEPTRLIAGVLLAGTTLVVIPILALTLRDWARGRLPVKTKAAIA